MPCKNRCGFISYIPSKPDKYGIKFWVLCEVKSKYVVNIIPYLGAQEKAKRGNIPLGESVVLELTQNIGGKGYNICCDNYFTSLNVAKKLKEKRISFIGTIKKNKRELNKVMTEPEKNKIFSSTFFWHQSIMFVKYQPKRNKTVCLLSSMHNKPEVDSQTKSKKPEVILYYNTNKVGVDSFDQMSRLYSTHTCSRRWPLAVWANMLDIAVINAWVVFKKCSQSDISRRDFIIKLAETLIGKHDGNQQQNDQAHPCYENRKRKRCASSNCRNMTNAICRKCQKYICGNCAEKGSKAITLICNKC